MKAACGALVKNLPGSSGRISRPLFAPNQCDSGTDPGGGPIRIDVDGVEFETEDGSGILRDSAGSYMALVEVPEDRTPEIQIALRVTDADAFSAGSPVEVIAPFEETRYGTREM